MGDWVYRCVCVCVLKQHILPIVGQLINTHRKGVEKLQIPCQATGDVGFTTCRHPTEAYTEFVGLHGEYAGVGGVGRWVVVGSGLW
jgi:hypothetical protein